VAGPFVVSDRDRPPPGVALRDLLDLERLDDDLFRSQVVFEEAWPLYGGQVFAQALLAAGATVDPARLPHSAHGYFLRPGDSCRPVVLRVERDRDGRSLSARRVVAFQGGKVILNLSTSFAEVTDDPDLPDLVLAPPHGAEPPGETGMPHRAVGFEQSLPPQGPLHSYPTRAWLRCTEPVEDTPLMARALVAYTSDLYSGHGALPESEGIRQPTIDHTIWFHRPLAPGSWVLSDLRSRTVSNGRGFYTGDLWSEDGRLVASIAQETLFRRT